MNAVRNLLLTALCILPCVAASAQVMLYQPDTSTKVIAYGREQKMAWCGGFNNPQFAMADLNNDGLKDLVVYESYIGVKTFINKGTAGTPDYRYAPEYALKFPPVFTYIVLADYNCDGIEDLFEGNSGFSVHIGYYNSGNQLCFKYNTELYYNNVTTSHGAYTPAFCNPGDIPSIVDIDGDNDLDFIAYNIIGGNVNLYRNMQVELGLPCDSIKIALKDRCWGKVYQGFWREHTLGISCDNSTLGRASGGESKKTHSGNTLCLFDWDMDGDMDYLDGSVSFNEMTFLKNGRVEHGIGIDSMVSQDTMWQSGGKRIDIPVWPSAFNIDIDQDGKKDLLISPRGSNASANYNNIWFYKNYSAPGGPDWRFQSDSFLTDMAIDLGSGAFPVLFDYNKDGKPDLFVGSAGYMQPSGLLRSRISFYLNTGTPGNSSFTLQTTDFLQADTFGFAGIAPAFGDIDNDGKTDLLMGHTDGTISYFKNMAASETAVPDWQPAAILLTDDLGDVINVGGYAAPFVYDMDNDGKKDMISGNIYGTLNYYRNVSATPGAVSLKFITTTLGEAKADGGRSFGNQSVPFVGRVDGSGMDYLLMGSNSGKIYRYTGFQTGDTAATYTLLDDKFSFIDTSYLIYNGGPTSAYDNLRSAVTVGDIDGDGDFEMIVGSTLGGLKFYKRKIYYDLSAQGPADQTAQLKLYPNPASEAINVVWSGAGTGQVELQILNMAGQLLLTTLAQAAAGMVALPVSSLPAGMYMCTFLSAEGRLHSKFLVLK